MSPSARRKSAGRKRGMHPLIISAVTIFATVFVIYYAFNEGLPFVHDFTLHAYVDNSVNVRQNAPVRIAGIDVGEVQGTSPAGRMTEINFTINSNGQPIHSDATIRIRDRLFLEGAYYLDLDPGSPSAPILKDGGVIPPAQTSYPVQFYNVLSTFDSATRASLESTLHEIDAGFDPSPGHSESDSGAGGLKQATPHLAPVLKDVAWVTQSLHGTQAGDVERLLSTASDVTTTLAGNSAQLADFVTSLDQTSSALAASDGALAQSVSGLDRTLQVAPAALSAVDHALPPVVKLANALGPSLKLAPPILDQVSVAVEELEKIVAPAVRTRLLTTLKATFEQFPTLLTKLGSAFPITKLVTDCLRTHVTPILDSIVPDGALSTGRPVWQDFIHFLPGLESAAQNFDANGYWIRLLAGAGTNSVSLGTLPIVGTLLGTTPSSSPIQGSRPVWDGDLTSSAFQPGASCASQPVPSLASTTGASDVHAIKDTPAKPLTLGQLTRAVERSSVAAKAAKAR